MGRRTRAALLAWVAVLSAASSEGTASYCRSNTFDRPTNSEGLHFSKENSDAEYGIYDRLKCLHCCTHGYRSIEWFKEGHPHPWSTDVSTLITDPRSGNQTVCSQRSTRGDSGRYWCMARNDTHALRHDVLLQISGPSISMGWPKTTYRPRDQVADRGEAVRFYCEAFVGTIDLPDFRSDISWERFDLNESFADGARVLQESVFREDDRILGSYLVFREVVRDDYGEYTCKVRNLGDQVIKLTARLKGRTGGEAGGRLEWTRGVRSFLLLFVLVLTAAMSTVTIVHFTFYLQDLREGTFRESSIPGAALGDSRQDLLVVCHAKDEREALRAVPGLGGVRRHSFCLHALDSPSRLGDEELKAKANSYRAVLALVSPSLTGGCWSCRGIHRVVQALLRIHFTVVCVFSQRLPAEKEDEDGWSILRGSLAKVHCLEMTEGSRLKFWAAPACRRLLLQDGGEGDGRRDGQE